LALGLLNGIGEVPAGAVRRQTCRDLVEQFINGEVER
jgi:hypothetical protein